MLLIQILAAILLLAGSALIFRALLALDMADRPRTAPRPRIVARLHREATSGGEQPSLRRAA